MRTSFRVVLVAAGLAALGVPGAAAGPADQVWFTFDNGSREVGQAQRSAKNLGAADLTARVVTRDGGRAERANGHGRGFAVRFPSYSASSREPRAVLRVTNDGKQDQLSPGTSSFAFGVDAKLRAKSQGTRTDNGNNVVQRGLYEDAGQYKLDLDGRRPGCRVKGALGAVAVRSSVRVNSRDWYRMVCVRDGSALTLRVVHFLGGGSRSTSTTTSYGVTGNVATANPAVPMSVGGKLDAGGQPMPSTDQFNGVVDRVFLRVAG